MFLSPLFRKAVLCCLPVSLLGSLALADGPLLITNGGEYSLSGALAGDQINASLAITTNGGFLIFEDNSGDGSGQGIGAVALDSNFARTGARIRVNQNRSGDQERPEAVLLPGGGAAIVWQSRPKSSPRHIFARFLSSSNTWLTGDIMVNISSKDSQLNPVIAALPNGNVVILYSSFNQAGNGSLQDVYGQIFSPAGQRISGEFLVNEFTSFNQRTPAVATLTSGGFLVAWVSENQRFENVVDVYGRLYSATGAALGGEFVINAGTTNVCANPALAATSDGFLAAWGELDSNSLTNGWDVFAREFVVSGGTATGGAQIQLNSYTFGDQFAPRVASLAGGSLAIWTSRAQDGSREGVYGRFIDATGAISGDEFRVNTTIAGAQKFTALAADSSARVVAAWSGFTQIGSGFDVYAQDYASPDYLALAATTNFALPKTDPFPTDNINGGGNGGGPSTPPGGSGSGTNGVPKGLEAARGVYYGEFFTGNGDDVTSAGSFTATINPKNGFSGKIVLGGKSYSVTGKFDADGKATVSVKKTNLILEFTLDLNGGNRIDGTLSGSGWSADLHAMRFSKAKSTATADFAGSYTLRIPADPDSPAGPGGDGFGTVRIDASGKVQFTGSLADGTKVSQKTGLSDDGYWPLFVSLYSGKGSLLGWLQVTNDTLNRTVVWTKSAGARGKNYSAGFTNMVEASGSSLKVGSAKAIKWSDNSGEVVLSGGGLAVTATNAAVITLNKITGSDKLKVTIVPGTGLFKGSISNPDSGKALKLQGAINQSDNTGFGYFLNVGQSGSVTLEDAP